jgi:hypothetical protein
VNNHGEIVGTGAVGKRNDSQRHAFLARPESSEPTPPSISIDDLTVDEADGGAAFSVSLSEPADTDVTVSYDTEDATATAGSDYTSTSGTLTILAGQTSGTISVPVIDDSVPDEGNETFNVNLLGATGAEIVDSQGQGTIVDNDGTQPPASFSINDVAKREGRTGKTTTFSFTVSRSGGALDQTTIHYATVVGGDGVRAIPDGDGDRASGEDYRSASGELAFGLNETTRTISISVYGDLDAEPHNVFLVKLTDEDGTELATATGTILNDDKGTPVESASVTDAALLAWVDVDTSDDDDSDILTQTIADDLALMLVE